MQINQVYCAETVQCMFAVHKPIQSRSAKKLDLYESFIAALTLSSARSMLLILACVIALAQTPAHARQSDLAKAIDVRADKSEYDEKAGTQTLSGNVEITQGTMKIKADKISISLQDNALSKIEGTGSPIRFEQENEEGELMQGEAKRIIYDAVEGTLILQGSATLTQPRQNLVSEQITFNSRTQKVSAEGGGDSGRVTIQIQPPTPSNTK